MSAITIGEWRAEIDRVSEKYDARVSCVMWLRGHLSDGPKPMREVFGAAREAGFSHENIRKSKVRAGVLSKKVGFGRGATWVWCVSGDLPTRSFLLRRRLGAPSHKPPLVERLRMAWALLSRGYAE
jgi:hypothetical protein